MFQLGMPTYQNACQFFKRSSYEMLREISILYYYTLLLLLLLLFIIICYIILDIIVIRIICICSIPSFFSLQNKLHKNPPNTEYLIKGHMVLISIEMQLISNIDLLSGLLEN